VQHCQVRVCSDLSQPRGGLAFFLDAVKTIAPPHAAVVLKVVLNPELQYAHQGPIRIVIAVVAARTAAAS
jgi:hypothetical protein